MNLPSPARLHYQRVVAARSAARSAEQQPVYGSDYELIFAKLVSDRQRLKQIQSIERKIEAKRSMVPDYQGWIDGVLQAGNGGRDDVLSTLMVWHIDIADYPRALMIADYVIRHQMTLPDQYQRDAATLLLDEIPEGILQQLASASMDPAEAQTILQTLASLTDGKDAPDQARAKLHKAWAYAILAQLGEADLQPEQLPAAQEAHTQLQRALSLFSGIGVKKDLERLERRIKKLAVSPT